jgi:hypothetical protein
MDRVANGAGLESHTHAEALFFVLAFISRNKENTLKGELTGSRAS